MDESKNEMKKQLNNSHFIQSKPTLILVGLGLLTFFGIALTFPFQNTLLNKLYPKNPSSASISPDTNLNGGDQVIINCNNGTRLTSTQLSAKSILLNCIPN